MTVTSADAAAEIAARALRTRVRDQLEPEYLRLRTVDRPALVEMLEAGGDGTDLAVVAQELAIVEDRIAAVHDYLGTVHDPHPGFGACVDCCLLLDTGEGAPRWVLLAALPVEDEQVIAADSPLGRALTDARPGQVISYLTHVGPRTARILEMEPAG